MPARTTIGGLDIAAFVLGPWETNCYVVRPAGQAECLLIDASFEPGPLVAEALRDGGRPVALVLTHAHVDHIAGVEDVRRAVPGLAVVMHAAEAEWLGDPVLNLSDFSGRAITCRPPERLVGQGDRVMVGGRELEVLWTPGHSPGGITLVDAGAGVAFVGDTLFRGSVGRTDLPGGDSATLERSIRQRLYTLPEGTHALGGHGPPTTIGRERRSNPYVSG